MLQGGWWVDRHAATLSILHYVLVSHASGRREVLTNRFCESSIRSLNTAHLMAQFNVGHITPDSSSEALVYLTTLDAIAVDKGQQHDFEHPQKLNSQVYRLGYALLSHHIPRNDAYVDEHALGAQMVMLADWAAEKWTRKNPHAYEEAFMKDLWKPLDKSVHGNTRLRMVYIRERRVDGDDPEGNAFDVVAFVWISKPTSSRSRAHTSQNTCGGRCRAGRRVRLAIKSVAMSKRIATFHPQRAHRMSGLGY